MVDQQHGLWCGARLNQHIKAPAGGGARLRDLPGDSLSSQLSWKTLRSKFSRPWQLLGQGSAGCSAWALHSFSCIDS